MQAEVRRRRAAGEYGFYGWCDQDDTVREIKTFAEGLGQAHDHVLVLGIGGSALGTKALLNALRRPAWNEWDDEGRDFFPRLTVLENVDPTTVAAALRRIDPRRVLVNVISKSGGTAETMAQYLVVRGVAGGGARARRRTATSCSPPIRRAARCASWPPREGIATLDVPPDVGGRFSVLSPVGLLPAALVGIDIEALLEGARRAVERAEADDLLSEPGRALRGAALGGRHRPRSPRPRPDAVHRPAAGVRRVVPAALGREPGQAGRPERPGRCTPDPLRSARSVQPTSTARCSSSWKVPSTRSSPSSTVDDLGEDVTIPQPASPSLPADLAYLPGHTLGELLRAEYEATSAALAQMGRMNCTLQSPRSRRRPRWARPSCSFSSPPGTPGSGTASIRSTSPAWSWGSGSPTPRWGGPGTSVVQ